MEQDKKIVGRIYMSTTSTMLDEDGYWKAINSITDKVLYEGETEWVEEKIESMALDRDSTAAIQNSMNGSLSYLMQNVYQKGFNGLVEYRAFERRLNEPKPAES